MIYTEDDEPSHVHAVRGDELVIFWFDCARRTISVRANHRVRSTMVLELKQFLGDNLELLCEAWRAIHGKQA